MDDQEGRGPRPRQVEVPGLSPVRAFLVVCTIATVLGTAFFATRDASPSEPPPPAPPPSPDYSLSDAEALAEFERLNAQLMMAYEERNIALAEAVFTSDSPMLPRVRKEIKTLIESDVVSTSEFDEISTRVSDNMNNAVTIRRVEILRPGFQTEDGRNAAGSTAPERLQVEWTLHVEQGQWLLHDAVTVDRKIIKRNR